jgi:hypothetical protein
MKSDLRWGEREREGPLQNFLYDVASPVTYTGLFTIQNAYSATRFVNLNWQGEAE